MDLQVVTSKRGKQVILYSGYRFNLKSTNKNNTIRWICANRTCPGAIITDNAPASVIQSKQHTCVPDVAKNEVELCIQKAKKRAREELTPVPQIYRQELVTARNMGLDFVTQIPELTSIKTSLYRERHNSLGVKFLPKSREQVIIPESIKENLIVDDGNEERILAFGYKLDSLLAGNTTFFLDGTFKSCCPLFDQLYTLHVDIGSTEERTCIVPAIYALLPNRKKSTYKRLFSCLKKQLKSFHPYKIHIDFEAAAISAVKEEFVTADVKGCNFHFNQALWRKVQQLGMTQAYRDNKEIRDHVKMVAALAHVPIEYVSEGWLSIMESTPQDEALTEFYDYFVDSWMDKEEIWVCSGERHRTTNSVEGWHNRFNKKIGKSHPNIYELLKGLQEEMLFYDTIYERNNVHMQVPKRAKKYSERDHRLETIIADLTAGRATISQTLRKLVYIVNFV